MTGTDPRLKGLWLISYEDYPSTLYDINQHLRIFSEYIDAIKHGRPEQILPWDNFLLKQVRGSTEFEKFLMKEHSF
ncbi:MAG: hypothetical protein QXG99_01055 [Conexivisphaerales archaeon]